MRRFALTLAVITSCGSTTLAGPYAPAAGQSGSTAIANTSPLFVEWASEVIQTTRGPVDIANPGAGLASFGLPSEALGVAEGNTSNIVSLGDGGQITLGFAHPITDGPGADFAVFENGFADNFLELAFVEVSSDGSQFARFPAVSLTQTSTQIGSFGSLDPTNLNNLAGKYRVGFGTPFDLGELAGVSPAVDLAAIRFVRVIDVVGSINPVFARLDSLGNRINEPYPTAFASGGFDLDGVGVLHMVPEPASIALVISAAAAVMLYRRARRGARPRRPGRSSCHP
jgi:hypothetical protein